MEAKEYTDKTNKFEILTELQHYGGNTNLIDFTTDALVAIFFACDGEPEKTGRVILLQKPSKVAPKDYIVKKPPRTIRRTKKPKPRALARGWYHTAIHLSLRWC